MEEPESTTRATRKCPTCGQWSAWHFRPTDTCSFCGALLDPLAAERISEEAARLERDRKGIKIDLIEIKPEDEGMVRWGKYLVRAVQLSFIAILSFIIWLVTLATG